MAGPQQNDTEADESWPPPPPDDSTIIFAGAADIDDDNMRQLLEGWLPERLELQPPVIQKTIPRGAKGLKKVLAWLTEQFPGDDDLDRPDDLPAYLTGLRSTDSTYLAVLWGDGGDEKTEALVDAASRHGITVLDLTDGLDELKLADNTPAPSEPETPARRRSGRRSTPATATAPAAAQDEDTTPPFDVTTPDTAPSDGLSPDARMLAGMLAAGIRAFADVLDQIAQGQPVPHASRPAKPPATRTWLKKPVKAGEEAEYHLKGRGRPRTSMKDWEEVQLTAEQERELGLAD